ncbi:MAG: aspartate aminotransferase family protein [Gaiellaceae bacterium MAG52_C11]|nr:aspartate aminotransferase family protein [Candidatus Gaiellasilicea maunaloa]
MSDRYAASRAHGERARRTIAGGVTSAIRASQRPHPIAFARSRGARIVDVDGNEYVDYALAYGPLLLGHSPEPVLAAVRRQLSEAIGFGASHRLEAELAEAFCRTVPCAERCLFSSSGSEAVAAALRIARSATGRVRVIKFLGHFHGWLDPLAVGGPGAADGEPASGGQDPAASASVTVCPWNDLEALERALGDDVAAVIMEPVAVNGGCFVPHPGYLQRARELTHRAGAVLIFDEVITGFRLALGGAQERLGVVPDLAVYAKALGAGFPISAVCGSAEVLEEAASGRVSHLGTLNGNPVSISAALGAVGDLERRADELYPQLELAGCELAEILRTEAAAAGVPLVVNQLGAAAYAFWSKSPVDSHADALEADGDAYRRFARALLDEGVHVIPRGLLYVSTAHTNADLEQTRVAVRSACVRVAAAAAPA